MRVWAALLLLTACHKVPLANDAGTVDFGVAHWFENEKVAYLFFSLAERSGRLINPEWRLTYSETSAQGGETVHPFAPVDFSDGVHVHVPTACGDDRLCASFSFKSDGALTAARIKFLYDKGADLGIEIPLAISNHAKGDSADAYSALAYGVFNEANDQLQVRIHHNFGTPPDAEVAAFGLTRRFTARSGALKDASLDEIKKAAEGTGTPLLFPAPFCTGTSGDGEVAFAGERGWYGKSFDAGDGKIGACFTLVSEDKLGATLTEAPAYGRRNPVLSQANLTLLTPLRETVYLPVIIAICPDDPAASGMVDDEFLTYQKHVLNLDGRATDLCFRIGQEKTFAADLETLLTTRLGDAKGAAATPADFLFLVLLHDQFSPEFRQIQASLTESLYKLAAAEVDARSPRLVGAMVYASSTNYQPNATQRKFILWCPQELAPEVLDPRAPLANENCTTTKAFDLDLKVINFVAPLGPLPSLTQYKKYVKDFGDAGLARDPHLRLFSVPTGETTHTEAGTKVTYFDRERYVIADGEAARICEDRLDPALSAFRLRPPGLAVDVPGVAVREINELWLSDHAAGEYQIGIGWEYPFWGGVTYKGALNGKIVSVVPFQKSFSAYQSLGDPKWSTQSWDFGRYVQHCHKYCDNPFFDASGTYQAKESWRGFREAACPAPVYPKVEGG